MTEQDPENTEEVRELTPRQVKTISHLVASNTHEEGRKAAGVGKDTIYKWLRIPAFKAELRRQRDTVVEEALDGLKSATLKAVSVLVTLLETSESDTIKRGAANDIIGHVLKSRELHEIEERLEQVERIVLERRTYR